MVGFHINCFVHLFSVVKLVAFMVDIVDIEKAYSLQIATVPCLHQSHRHSTLTESNGISRHRRPYRILEKQFQPILRALAHPRPSSGWSYCVLRRQGWGKMLFRRWRQRRSNRSGTVAFWATFCSVFISFSSVVLPIGTPFRVDNSRTNPSRRKQSFSWYRTIH